MPQSSPVIIQPFSKAGSKLASLLGVFGLQLADELRRIIIRRQVRWNATLEVIYATFLEEVLRRLRCQNVLPFVLPFAWAIGKL